MIAIPSASWVRAACIAGAAIPVGAAHGQQVRVIQQDRPSVFVRTDQVTGEDPEAPARLSRIIDDLNSTDFRTRCNADRALSEDTGITLRMIERELKSRGDALTLDTRERLCSAARARFNVSPRAAMGIQFWQNVNLRDRVVIEKTFPKFDAHGKIEEGDMVVEADGVKTVGPAARSRFQAVIVSHDPGDVIGLVIRRGDRRMNVDVRLGRRDELESNPGVTPDILERAWRVRAESILGPADRPIAPPTVPDNWAERAPSFRNDRMSMRRKSMAMGGPTLVGGGMPRGAEQINAGQDSRQYAQVFRRNGQVIINNGVIFLPGFAGVDPFGDSPYPAMKPQEELAELQRARDQYALLAGKAPPGRRVLPDGPVVMAPESPTRELSIIDKQIAAVRAEMIEAGLPLPETAAAGQPVDEGPAPGEGRP